MKYPVFLLAKSIILSLSLSFSAYALSSDKMNDPHYTPPSESIKNFFGGIWEGSLQVGYAFPQSGAQIDNSTGWAVGIYHDIGSRMATELQYLSSGDFDSNAALGASASFQTNAIIASLRGYGRQSAMNLTYFGRLGMAFYDVSFDNGSTVDDNYESGNTAVLGFGAERKTDENTTFSIELTYYQDMVQSGYVNWLSLGVRRAIGR